MIVLVDYDNIPKFLQQRGVLHVLTRILESIDAVTLSQFPRVRVRLYDGWYEDSNLTRKAQDLTAEIGIFPRSINVVNAALGSVSPIVSVELARSLAAEPRFILENTLRRRSVPFGLRCEVPPYAECSSASSCPIDRLHEFINDRECPTSGCSLTTDLALHRTEQKLVDGMIIADLIYFAGASLGPLVVVSSDDDIWTGIKSALLLGCRILHLHPIAGRSTHVRYKRDAGSNYSEGSL